MKVLALNSSPRSGGESYTVMMLNPLVEGMRDAGADVEVVNLREKKIKNCIGCFTCWTKTPGKCVHKDDMTNELFPKWLASDLVIYATPLYNHTINAAMSAFWERILPALLPFLSKMITEILSTLCGIKSPRVPYSLYADFPKHRSLMRSWNF